MKSLLANIDTSPDTSVQTRQSLYNKYADMLLGYITEVVKNKQVAEQYLIDIFSELQFNDIQAISKPGVNAFCQLQIIAKKKLSQFFTSLADCADNTAAGRTLIKPRNRFIEMMAPEQQAVFCGIHYHGKTTAMLASELNKPEDTIRRILRESFTIIRNNRNDTATVHR